MAQRRTDIERDIDRLIGVRLRQARIGRGLNQTQLGEMMGTKTFQQVQKWENGVNRVPAARLFLAAQGLAVPLSYFFEGLDQPVVRPLPHERALIELGPIFEALSDEQRASLCRLARAMSDCNAKAVAA